MNDQMLEQMANKGGFIAALDQSGGSTPKALAQYGVTEGEYSGDEQMFALVHEMRVRIMTAPAFTGDKVIGAILFEKTMDGQVKGQAVPTFLWKERGIVPFLKIDKGLEAEKNGVQMMKPMPGLDGLLERAAKLGIFGTKERSTINLANREAITAVVAQQFEVAAQVNKHGLVPIIEPEVLIKSPNKAEAEQILHDELKTALGKHAGKVMLKVTLPETPDLYKDLAALPNVVRVVALSGGYPLDVACTRLAQNHGMIASFSRALADDLKKQMSDAEFDKTLATAIEKIYGASVNKS